MVRQNWAFAASLIFVFGLTTSALAQTLPTGTPPTAYRQDGKWVGYVPSYQKYSQPTTSRPFRSSVPDIGSYLAGAPQASATAAGAAQAKSATYGGTLLDSQKPATQSRVLATAYEQPTPAMDPAVESLPMFDPAGELPGEGCSEGCASGCDSCSAAPAMSCAPNRFYGNADYLLWWLQGMGTPPLVTSSPNGTSQANAGVLGQPGTTTLFGGTELEGDSLSGGRFSLGLWLDPCQTRGLEASYFMLGTQTTTYAASDNNFHILARPFYNTEDAAQDARLIAFDNLVSGSVAVTASTRLDGAELLFRQSLGRECWSNIDLLFGYRWVQLEDGLLIQESTESLVSPTTGTTFDLYDRFDTRNNFHGGEIGMALRRPINHCWSVELLAKVGIGNMDSTVTIDGQTTTVSGTGTAQTAGGLLALPTNMGQFDRRELSTATEVGLKLTRAFDRGVDLTFGYNFLYLSNVLRAGDQIDTNINVSQLSGGTLDGAAFPQFNFQSSGFWAQGLSIGLEARF
ncbi:MAG: BBP7 family outer membrane beta-barrel protein [Thermoguttaceae bacterium]